MNFDHALEIVVRCFEVVGIGVLAIGSLAALARAALSMRSDDRASVYPRVRRDIGRSILLGLEILIIADIIQTITIDPTLESAAVLGIIVLVRTFLSFSLEIELEGDLPWRRGRLQGEGRQVSVRHHTDAEPASADASESAVAPDHPR